MEREIMRAAAILTEGCHGFANAPDAGFSPDAAYTGGGGI